MSGDYISREYLGLTDFEIIMCNGDYKAGLKMLLEKVEKAPAADVVEVVRCRECKYRAEDDFCTGRGWPDQLVADDGFCEKGKRRDGGPDA